MSGKSDHVRVTTMERLDQGHLHPLLESNPRLTCPSRESKRRPLQWEASTKAKSYSNSLLIAILSIYSTWAQDSLRLWLWRNLFCELPESRLSTSKHSIAHLLLQLTPAKYSDRRFGNGTSYKGWRGCLLLWRGQWSGHWPGLRRTTSRSIFIVIKLSAFLSLIYWILSLIPLLWKARGRPKNTSSLGYPGNFL